MSIQFNPNTYAQQFATQNNLTIDEAKNKLKSMYGDPVQQDQDRSIFAQELQPSGFSNSIDSDFSFLNEGTESFGGGNILNTILDFLKSSLGLEQGSTQQDGPQKEGDPEFHKQQNGIGGQNTQMNPFGQGQQQMGMGGQNMQMSPFGQNQPPMGMGGQNMQMNQAGSAQPQDPNAYAQQYANENNMTLEEAKAELREKYGDPQAPNANSSTTNPFGSTTNDVTTEEVKETEEVEEEVEAEEVEETETEETTSTKSASEIEADKHIQSVMDNTGMSRASAIAYLQAQFGNPWK